MDTEHIQAELPVREVGKAAAIDTEKLGPRVEAPACGAPSWRNRHWFPIASVHELDPDRPTPVRIDGLSLVVWHVPVKDAQPDKITGSFEDDGWKVFADLCPHRLAPLSEGRIEKETGCIQCSYHGWEFNGEGKCEKIPSADIKSCDRACKLSRSSAVKYPSAFFFGVVWAWLGEEPPRGSPSDLLKGTELEGEKAFKTYTRDLPYGYDTLLENLMDPAHVPFAHHGLQGTRDDAAPITVMDVPRGKAENLSFTFEDITRGAKRKVTFNLSVPFFGYYRGVVEAPSKKPPFKLTFIGVPVAPGESRLILLYTGKKQIGAHRDMLLKFPTWVIHLFSNRFIDSDLIFLHHQERILRAKPRTAGTWKTAYFMPAKVDQAITLWRKWLEREGAACVSPDHELCPVASRESLLNRFEQHTQYCRHCQNCIVAMELWQWRLGKAGLAALVLERLGLRSNTASRMLLAFQVIAVGIIAGLQSCKSSFHFVDYKHYSK